MTPALHPSWPVPADSTHEPFPAPSTPDRSELDRLVIDHLHLVEKIARTIRCSLPSFVSIDDLIQAGTLGLIDAARRFSPDKQVPFASYAKHRIRGAIIDSLRKDDDASRDSRVWQRSLQDAISGLTAKLCRPPEEAEIAGHLGVNVERFRTRALRLQVVNTVSISSWSKEDRPDHEIPTDPTGQADSILARKQVNGALADAMKRLPVRYQMVVKLYYFGELTMREIGTQLGVNESRISQIHRLAIARLGKSLRDSNIEGS